MHSAGTRSVTVVTILTLFFVPVFKGHHWMSVLTGQKTETRIVVCQPGDPCPAQKHIKVRVDLPPQP